MRGALQFFAGSGPNQIRAIDTHNSWAKTNHAAARSRCGRAASRPTALPTGRCTGRVAFRESCDARQRRVETKMLPAPAPGACLQGCAGRSAQNRTDLDCPSKQRAPCARRREAWYKSEPQLCKVQPRDRDRASAILLSGQNRPLKAILLIRGCTKWPDSSLCQRRASIARLWITSAASLRHPKRPELRRPHAATVRSARFPAPRDYLWSILPD